MPNPSLRLAILIILGSLSLKQVKRSYEETFGKEVFNRIYYYIVSAKIVLMTLILFSHYIPVFHILRGALLGLVVGGACVLIVKLRQGNLSFFNAGYILLDFCILGLCAEFFSSFIFSFYLKNLIR